MDTGIYVHSADPEDLFYEFAFTPVKPLDPDYRHAYAEAQRAWLEKWQPYEWHFVQ